MTTTETGVTREAAPSPDAVARARQTWEACCKDFGTTGNDETCTQIIAAAIAQAVSQECERLREALKPFADFAASRALEEGLDESAFYGPAHGRHITRGDLRRARAALAEPTRKPDDQPN